MHRSFSTGAVCNISAVICGNPICKVIAKKAGNALHILDRSHIMAHMSKAIDEVRAKETKELKEQGLELGLTKSRWLLLKRTKNLMEKRFIRLKRTLFHGGP
uniref:Transposase n=1 Tax=Candidatus Kentrum sp. LFY TaxID=2126342 RepID=A0A450W852_9GAMM|nr:MAG: Transposase [Candidatus Kentron sp. LFY]